MGQILAIYSPDSLSPSFPSLSVPCEADLCELHQCVLLHIDCQFCKYRHWQETGGPGVYTWNSLIYFSNGLQFSVYRSFHLLGYIYSQIFYSFGCYCNWNCFHNFLCCIFHCWCIDTHLIFVLILHPATLLDSFISSSKIFIGYLVFYIQAYVISEQRCFYFSLSNLNALSFFS